MKIGTKLTQPIDFESFDVYRFKHETEANAHRASIGADDQGSRSRI